jgi:hypothetical protein
MREVALSALILANVKSSVLESVVWHSRRVWQTDGCSLNWYTFLIKTYRANKRIVASTRLKARPGTLE